MKNVYEIALLIRYSVISNLRSKSLCDVTQHEKGDVKEHGKGFVRLVNPLLAALVQINEFGD